MENIQSLMQTAVWVFGGVATVLVLLVAGYFVVRRMGTMRGF